MSYIIHISKDKLTRLDKIETKIQELIDSEQEKKPSVQFVKYINVLTETFTCLTKAPDNEWEINVWSDGPVINNAGTNISTLAFVFSKVKKVLPLAIKVAQGMGLYLYDPQTEKIHKPGIKGKKGSSKYEINQIKSFIVTHNCKKLHSLLNSKNINFLDRSNNNFLHYCAEYGNLEVFKLLHSKGVDIDGLTKQKELPFHLAILHGRIDIVNYCIQNGVDVNVRTKKYSPLYISIRTGKINLLELLINAGADINEIDEIHEGNLIFEAVRVQLIEVLIFLINKGLDVNHKQKFGHTPIMECPKTNSNQTITSLVKNGADVYAKNSNGYNVLTQHWHNKNYSGMHTLLSLGTDFRDIPTNQVNFMITSLWKDTPQTLDLEQYSKEVIGIDLPKFVSPEPINWNERIKEYLEETAAKSDYPKFELNFSSEPFRYQDVLPIQLITYSNLKELELSNSNMPQLADFIGDFKDLESFRMIYLKKLEKIPASIGLLSKLKVLEIYCIKIAQIPSAIKKLQNLEKLIIRSGEFKKIPAEINQLVNLRELSISSNNISTIPDLSALVNLEKLTIELTQLTEFPNFILELPKLKELSIPKNKITNIPRKILDLDLKKFNFQHNPLSNPPKNEIKGGFKGIKLWFEKNKNT